MFPKSLLVRSALGCAFVLFASCNLYQSIEEVDAGNFDDVSNDAREDDSGEDMGGDMGGDTTTIDANTDATPDMETIWVPPGPVYYVATDGDDSNDGSIESPWQTFAFATSNLVANDTLYIRGGTYTEQLSINVLGTPQEPIHVRAFPDEDVLIHELDIPLSIQNAQHLHLFGITLGDAFVQWGNVSDTQGLVLENITARVTRPTPDATTDHEGFEFVRADSTIMRNVHFGGWGFRDDASRDGHNITVISSDYFLIEDSFFGDSGSSSVEVVSSTHFMIRSSVLEAPSTTCVLFLGASGSIIGNDIRLCGGDGIGIGRSSSDVLIRNNTVWGSATGLNISGNPNSNAENYRIFNNTFVLNNYEGVVIDDEDDLGIDFVNIVLKNNIVARNQVMGGTETQLLINDFQNPSFGDVTVVNNLFSNQNTAQCTTNLQSGDGAGECPLEVVGVGNGDVSWMQSQTTVQFSSNLEGDPRFRSVRPVVGEIDLQLEQTSPALDAGSPLTFTVGSETSNKVVVDDATYFHDDLLGLTQGDTVTIGTQTAIIEFVDLVINELTLDRPVTYADGDPVTLRFSGTGLDLGALESPL